MNELIKEQDKFYERFNRKGNIFCCYYQENGILTKSWEWTCEINRRDGPGSNMLNKVISIKEYLRNSKSFSWIRMLSAYMGAENIKLLKLGSVQKIERLKFRVKQIKPKFYLVGIEIPRSLWERWIWCWCTQEFGEGRMESLRTTQKLLWEIMSPEPH